MHHKTKASAVKKYAPIFAERGKDEAIQTMINDDIIETDANEIAAEIQAVINAFAANMGKAPEVEVKEPGNEKRKTELVKGQKLYDIHKVTPDLKPDPENPRKQIFAGTFTKDGPAIKTNIKVVPEIADAFNEQSHNSKQRMYEIETY